ncbi:MAG: hypothetical protein IJB24_00675 [Clostridia bacterium]|nr:hypothetical protein [Clostridia bacterium]
MSEQEFDLEEEETSEELNDSDENVGLEESTEDVEGPQSSLDEQTQNIIVAVISVIFVVLLLITVGFKGIKQWITSPITWDKPEYFNMELIEVESDDYEVKLSFLLTNESEHSIDEYDIHAFYCGEMTELSGYHIDDLEPYDAILYEETYSSSFDSEEYELLKGKTVDEIDFEYRIKKLVGDEGKLVHNNGWMKVIIIIATAVVCGFLVLSDIVTNPWWRILLKLACVPAFLLVVFAAIAVVLILIIGAGSNSPEVKAANADRAKKDAARRYKQAASQRAGHAAHGNHHEAQMAQARMDQAMADMISPGNSSAKAQYKRAASQRAGAAAHGDKHSAAQARATMDRLMADMINNSDK